MNEYKRLKEAFDRQSEEVSFLRRERDEICKVVGLLSGAMELKEAIINLHHYVTNLHYREIMRIISTWEMPARRLIIQDLFESLPDDEERQEIFRRLKQTYQNL